MHATTCFHTLIPLFRCVLTKITKLDKNPTLASNTEFHNKTKGAVFKNADKYVDVVTTTCVNVSKSVSVPGNFYDRTYITTFTCKAPPLGAPADVSCLRWVGSSPINFTCAVNTYSKQGEPSHEGILCTAPLYYTPGKTVGVQCASPFVHNSNGKPISYNASCFKSPKSTFEGQLSCNTTDRSWPPAVNCEFSEVALTWVEAHVDTLPVKVCTNSTQRVTSSSPPRSCGCWINGKAYFHQQVDPNNVCRWCDVLKNPNGWSFRAARCDDSKTCSHTDQCQPTNDKDVGKCVGTLYSCPLFPDVINPVRLSCYISSSCRGDGDCDT